MEHSENRTDVVVFDLNENDEVIFAGTNNVMGHINDDMIRKVLLAVPYYNLAGKIHNRMFKIVEDPYCCPVCGTNTFKSRLEIEKVSIGYCQNCQTQIAKDSYGRWNTIEITRPFFRRRKNLWTGAIVPC